MCVVSMIHDHFRDKWDQPWRTNPYRPLVPNPPYEPYPTPFDPPAPVPMEPPPPITDDEIREFRELLKRARKYDKDNNQKDCGSEKKMKELLELAEKLGVRDKVEKAIRDDD